MGRRRSEIADSFPRPCLRPRGVAELRSAWTGEAPVPTWFVVVGRPWRDLHFRSYWLELWISVLAARLKPCPFKGPHETGMGIMAEIDRYGVVESHPSAKSAERMGHPLWLSGTILSLRLAFAAEVELVDAIGPLAHGALKWRFRLRRWLGFGLSYWF